jgi:hypothetical protein
MRGLWTLSSVKQYVFTTEGALLRVTFNVLSPVGVTIGTVAVYHNVTFALTALTYHIARH